MKFGGNKKRNFTEGWVEFADRRVAKAVAMALNNVPIGGRKRNYYHDDIWNIKYLPKFRWTHLAEKKGKNKCIVEGGREGGREGRGGERRGGEGRGGISAAYLPLFRESVPSLMCVGLGLGVCVGIQGTHHSTHFNGEWVIGVVYHYCVFVSAPKCRDVVLGAAMVVRIFARENARIT